MIRRRLRKSFRQLSFESYVAHGQAATWLKHAGNFTEDSRLVRREVEDAV